MVITVTARWPSADHDRRCVILLGEGLLDEIGRHLSSLLRERPASSIVVVTDSKVPKRYVERLGDSIVSSPQATGENSSSKFDIVSFPAGEKSKTLEMASVVSSRMSDLGADRNSVVLALGGGVVGDLGGFVASIYKRGIRYFQIPTTLLAQVDSSIGGKTGVDTTWGKNQLGTFYQPLGVFIDPASLDTLPQSELINGIGEIVKCTIIANRQMFFRVSRTDLNSVSDLKRLIEPVCRIKADVTSKDEREENLRSILNYGHTVAHAIEASLGYEVSHGRAVVLGMVAEGWIARELGIFEQDDHEKQEEFLAKICKSEGLSTSLGTRLDKQKLARFAFADKKSSASTIRMSLPEQIGRMHSTGDGSYRTAVPVETFLASIDYLRSFLSNLAA